MVVCVFVTYILFLQQEFADVLNRVSLMLMFKSVKLFTWSSDKNHVILIVK